MPFDLAIILFVRIVWNATKTMSTWFLMRVEKKTNNFAEDKIEHFIGDREKPKKILQMKKGNVR